MLLFFAGAKRNLFVATAAMLIFVINPMTAYTASLAWNHSLPVLCTLAALLLLEKPTRRRIIAAGLCAGCAAMLRHSYPPVILALAIYLAMSASWRRVAEFLGAALLPIIPIIFLPLRQVWFGLFVYPGLSRDYWAAQAIHLPRTMGEKLKYLAHANLAPIGPATLLITAAVVVACRFDRRIRGTLLVIAALLIGILAPTPMMQQYPFALVPFFVLLIVYAIESSPRCAWAILIPAIGVAFSARFDLPAMQTLPHPSAWIPLQIHRVAQRISKDTPAPIYTLAPLFPVEANLDFDPACATGPFAWRIAPLLSKQDRERFGIVGEDDWWKRGVGTVILGDRNTDDIATSATEHGYRKVQDERAYSALGEVKNFSAPRRARYPLLPLLPAPVSTILSVASRLRAESPPARRDWGARLFPIPWSRSRRTQCPSGG